MSPLDARKRDLVKCEDMRIHAVRAQKFLAEEKNEDQAGEREHHQGDRQFA